jgi:hypothetical protein
VGLVGKTRTPPWATSHKEGMDWYSIRPMPYLWRAPTDLCTEPVFIKPICSKNWLWNCFQEGQNETHKWRKFKFWSVRCFLLRDEDLSCSLAVLYGGLGISKLLFWSNKKIFLLWIFSNFWPSKHRIWIRIRIDKKCWIRIRNETNADPQHCKEAFMNKQTWLSIAHPA